MCIELIRRIFIYSEKDIGRGRSCGRSGHSRGHSPGCSPGHSRGHSRGRKKFDNDADNDADNDPDNDADNEYQTLLSKNDKFSLHDNSKFSKWYLSQFQDELKNDCFASLKKHFDFADNNYMRDN